MLLQDKYCDYDKVIFSYRFVIWKIKFLFYFILKIENVHNNTYYIQSIRFNTI